MSRDQIAILISVSFVVISYICIVLVTNLWQKKHQLYYVVFRSPDTHLKYCVEFFRSKDAVSKWLKQYGSLFILFGVYTLVPSSYLKEFGGFYDRSK